MSSLAGTTQAVVASASQLAAASSFAQKLTGSPKKVQFIQNGTNTVFSLDISENETHSRESQPTQFPIEGGATISDHLLIGPLTLDITGVISDFPLGTAQQLVAEGITTALSSAGALGLVAAGSAYALYTAIQSQHGAQTPSVRAYAQLLKLQAGDPTASPPILPQPFDVKTSLYLYPNMIIKSLTVPRDSTTGTSLVFTVSLQQLLLVQAQTINVALFDNPGLASEKEAIGEKAAEGDNAFLQGYNDTVAAKNALVDGVTGFFK